jgi:hypothetical protein
MMRVVGKDPNFKMQNSEYPNFKMQNWKEAVRISKIGVTNAEVSIDVTKRLNFKMEV